MQNNKKTSFGKIILSTLILYSFFYIVYPCLFEVNDDVINILITSGYFSVDSTPSHHTVFISSIIGYILQFLYSLNKSVEWYFVNFFLLQILSVSIIYYILINKLSKSIIRIFFTVFFYCFTLYFLYRIQFTTTAYLVCIAGFLLLINTIDNKSQNKIIYITSVFLIVYAYLIRVEVFISTLIIFSPLIVLNKNIKKLSIVLCFTFIIIGILTIINNYNYSSPQWKVYKAFNKARGEFNYIDIPLLNSFNDSIIRNGYVNEDEFFIYKHYMLPTENINTEILIKLKKNYDKLKNSERKPIIENIKKFTLNYIKEIIILFVLFSALLLNIKKNYVLIFTLLSFGCLFVYLCISGIPKNRVFYGLFFALLIIIIYYYKHISNYLLLFLFISVTVLSVNRLKVYFTNNNTSIINAHNYFSLLNPNWVYINIVSVKLEDIVPHKISKLVNNKYKFIFNGWLTYSPHHINQFKKFLKINTENKSTYSIFKESLLENDVYFAVNNKDSIMNIKIKNYYFKDQYNVSALNSDENRINLLKYYINNNDSIQ